MRTQLRGPGYFEAWNNNGTWYDNHTYRYDLDTNGTAHRNDATHKCVYVGPMETVTMALARTNAEANKKAFFDTYTQVIGKDFKPAPVAAPVKAPEPVRLPESRSIVPGSFRPYVEGLTKDQVIGFLNEGAAELIRRDLREKEAEETSRRDKEYEARLKDNQARVYLAQQAAAQKWKAGEAGTLMSNFMTGVVHALGIQRQLFRQEYKHPDPSPLAAKTMVLKTGADWTALDIARATKTYKAAGVRKKSHDPVDAKPPWEREAKEHLDFKLRQAAAPGGWNEKKAPPVKTEPYSKPHVNFPGTFTQPWSRR